jgi:hypothetical protein
MRSLWPCTCSRAYWIARPGTTPARKRFRVSFVTAAIFRTASSS